MDSVKIDRTHILILNYNGRHLLDECLGSVVDAARSCPVPCPVTMIDNGSRDGSVEWLTDTWPAVNVIHQPNRGLASFNAVLATMDEPAVLLLNNDVKLDAGAVEPLLHALESSADALFSAPQCWTFDGQVYEGMRTRVRSRFGLVQGMCRVPGFERAVAAADLTAAAGPILAIHRERFLALGGYDELYWPGRIEDLDLGFAGWMNGWRGYYVPASLAYHRGAASFGPAFGSHGCDRLAIRNSLLFAWKNLAGRRFWQHLAWLPARVVHALVLRRTAFLAALFEALGRYRQVRSRHRMTVRGRCDWIERQESFFRRFSW